MMLSLKDVDTYYDKSQILFGVSMSVEAGEIATLLGRNGAGKTTTLRTIAGAIAPRQGSIKLHGVEIAGRAPHEVARMGVALVLSIVAFSNR